MLPAAHRMRSSVDFTTTVRQGRRSRRGAVVVHHRACGAPAAGPALVGFVVGRAVGGSVTRHRVSRQLRHVTRPLVPLLPDGSRTVVRALPEAATTNSAGLSRDVEAALTRVLGR